MLRSATYRVSEREAGKRAERDQSFRNCVVTMLIFLTLCIIIVVVTLPWRKAHHTTSEIEKKPPANSQGLVGNSSTHPTDNKNSTTNGEKNILTKIPETTDRITTEITIPSSTAIVNNDTIIMPKSNFTENLDNEMTTKSLEVKPTTSSEINSTETHNTNQTVVSNEIDQFFTTDKAASMSPNLPEITGSSEDWINTAKIDETRPEKLIETIETSTEVLKLSKNGLDTTEINSNSISEVLTDAEEYSTSSEQSPWTSEAPEKLESPIEDSEGSENTHESTTMNLIESSNDETSDYSTSDAVESSSAMISASSDPTDDTLSSDTLKMSEEQFSTTTESLWRVDDALVSSTSPVLDSTALEENYSTENRRKITNDFYFTDGESTPWSLEEFDTTTEQHRSEGEHMTSLLGLVVRTYLGNDSTETDFPGNWLDSADVTPTAVAEKTTADAETLSSQTTHLPNVSSTARVIDVETLTSESYSSSRTNKVLLTMNQKIMRAPGENEICRSGQCKQVASRMLSFMNHSADPCEDFYEYACGGMEADSQRNNRDLAAQALERIEDSMKKRKSASFKTYFDSCLVHYQYTTHEEKIKNVKTILKNVGKFYTASDWPENYSGITELIANMMLHNSPLLFDITLDTNDLNPEKFILKLSPPLRNSPLYFPEHDSCFESHQVADRDVDLEKLYNNYKACKNNTNKIMDSISEALKELEIFNHLPNTYNISQYLSRTIIDIDLEIINKSLSHYPSEAEILRAHRSKIFSIMTLGALEAESNLLNWTQLLFTLTGKALKSDTEVQIYFKDELDQVLRSLGTFGQWHKLELNNALLGLYARELYTTLVKRRSRDVEGQCLLIASRLLPDDASSLYISSFSTEEINTMKFTVHKVFGDLKDILKTKLHRVEWATEAREQLLEKLEDIQLLTPEISHVRETFMPTIAENYLTSTVQLMRRLRETMYSILEQNPRDHKHRWTFFAKPFQSSSQSIYGLGLILMPFGAIDWNLQENYADFDYLTLANIGNIVAREIAHHFDANGISYWNGMRSISSFNNPITTSIYDSYLDCHNRWLFPEPIGFYLPASRQQIHLAVPSMTLNQRLADATGLLITRNILDKFNSNKILPWLDLTVHQLFYLAYAQTLCTKTPLTTSYASLYEEGILPSRIRVFATAINIQQLGRAWQCPEGSKVLPSSSCTVFPDLDITDDPVLSV